MSDTTYKGEASDPLDIIVGVRRLFLAAGYADPPTILLSSRNDGMRFLCELKQDPRLVMDIMARRSDFGREVLMADGSAWMEVVVMDVKVRWPTERLALPDGTWRHI